MLARRTSAAQAFSSPLHVPAGTPHRYRNPTDQQVRLLVVTSGGEQVAFVQGVSAPTADGPADAGGRGGAHGRSGRAHPRSGRLLSGRRSGA